MSDITLEQLDFAEKEATMGFTPTCWGVDLFNLARDGIKCRNSHAALVAACMAAAIPLEALRLDNEAGSQLIAPPLRRFIAEACDKIHAALAGRDGKP